MNKLTFGLLLCTSIFLSINSFAQDKKEESGFQFKTISDIKTTSVKNQQSTGTCWCFATISFLETELLRTQGKEYDLSEMFIARNTFVEKGKKYFRFHGKTNFSEGGQAHDVLMMMKKYGIVTEEAYKGLNYGSNYHIHQELVAELKGILDGLNKNGNKKISTAWERAYTGFIDAYLGEIPTTFKDGSKDVTPKEFCNKLDFNADDYIELTSYSCYPFYEQVELEIPDNWTHSRYYNLPIDELIEVMNTALKNGYSFAWDGDVSGKGFSHRNGLAILPTSNKEDMVNSEMGKWDSLSKNEKRKMLYSFKQPVPEMKVSDAKRQIVFDNRKTTDDHLMHATGMYKDQYGTVYYKIKNSWDANSNSFGGYLKMSEAYAKMQTVAIMVHKDALSRSMKKKLGIK